MTDAASRSPEAARAMAAIAATIYERVAQRIEVIDKTEGRIMGSRTALLKTLTAASE